MSFFEVIVNILNIGRKKKATDLPRKLQLDIHLLDLRWREGAMSQETYRFELENACLRSGYSESDAKKYIDDHLDQPAHKFLKQFRYPFFFTGQEDEYLYMKRAISENQLLERMFERRLREVSGSEDAAKYVDDAAKYVRDILTRSLPHLNNEKFGAERIQAYEQKLAAKESAIQKA